MKQLFPGYTYFLLENNGNPQRQAQELSPPAQTEARDVKIYFFKIGSDFNKMQMMRTLRLF